jgi:hypothetical protein
MKIANKTLVAALATVVLSLFAGSAQAQVKGGERLQQLNGSSFTATVTPIEYKPMLCGQCKDVFTNVPDVTAKGAEALMALGVPTKTVVTHLCADCKTTIKVVSLGRHSPADTVTHNCASCDTGKLAASGTENESSLASLM